MKEYKNIVVGYDGSKYSDAALTEAIDMARAGNGKLFIVTSADINVELEAMAPGAASEVESKATADLERAMAKAKVAGIDCEAEFQLMADPHNAIVDCARKNKADLIVLGTHGRTGLTRLLMGSTTERVIGHAPCAVLVIRCD